MLFARYAAPFGVDLCEVFSWWKVGDFVRYEPLKLGSSHGFRVWTRPHWWGSGGVNSHVLMAEEFHSHMVPVSSLVCDFAKSGNELIPDWVKIGKANPWIRNATDPRFDASQFVHCSTLEELRSWFQHGNWSLGSAFFFRNVCFINQVDGGDEWLTIKDRLPFESMNMISIMKRGDDAWMNLMKDILCASERECRELNYDNARLQRTAC